MALTYRAVEREHLTVDAAPSALLTMSNPKTAKGEGYGYLTAILHLAPARLAGFETCAGRTEGCTAACLNTAGRGGFDPRIVRARIRKTKWFRADRDAFMQTLEREIATHVRSAARHGLTPCVRLNGTSDIPWENVKYTAADGTAVANIFDRFPDVQFYDYTKLPMRAKRDLPANYDLTFSLADGNDRAAEFAAEHGMRVAVVFRNEERPTAKRWHLPNVWRGLTVVDADAHDLRFTEPRGVIAGLRAKGHAKRDATGFVQNVRPALVAA